MAEDKMIRASQAARKLNVGLHTIIEFLAKKGHVVENNPNAKLTPEQYALLSKEYASSATEKLEASNLQIGVKHIENVVIEPEKEVHKKKAEDEESILIKNIGAKEVKVKEEPKPQPSTKVEVEKPKLEGLKVVDKIDLEPKPKAKKEEPVKKEKAPEPVAPVAEVKPKAEIKPEPPAPVVEKIKEVGG